MSESKGQVVWCRSGIVAYEERSQVVIGCFVWGVINTIIVSIKFIQ